MKGSFILYTENLEQVEMLTLEQRGTLFTAILYYASGKELPDMDAITSMAFSIIRSRIDINSEKYEAICKKRAESGKLGGRPKKEDTSEHCHEDGLEIDKRGGQEEIDASEHYQADIDKANGFSEKQKKQMVFSKSKRKQKNPDTDTETETDTDTDIVLKDVCTEPEKSAPSPPAAKFQLNDGTYYEITEDDVGKYQKLYPGIDVRQQLRNIEGWCDANPTRRKTRTGAKRFINSWLSREQNRGSLGQISSRSKTKFNNFEERKYNYSALERDLFNQQFGGM